MTRAELLALADRVEREEPSDELNWCIQEAVHPEWRRTTAEPYTTSLDAAASLVPPGCQVYEVSQEQSGTTWHAALWTVDDNIASAKAPTEPRARTAAALRARAMEMADD